MLETPDSIMNWKELLSSVPVLLRSSGPTCRTGSEAGVGSSVRLLVPYS